MKKYLYVISLLIILITPITAIANQTAEKLGVCLADSLNGKERKELAKWMYFAMSAHSTIKPYTKITKKDIDNMNKYVGALITRLMTEDCPQIAKEARKEIGLPAFEYAFGFVGKIAMEELMIEPSVTKAVQSFEPYLDQDKFNQVFK